MAVVAPPSITALPSPPDPSNRGTFNALAYPWSVALGAYSTQIAAVATNVAANATDAQTNATTATTKAAEAVVSAAAALASQSSVAGDAASILTMDKRYLGSKSSAPTLDNQGAAIATGAVYYDTVLLKVRTWTGSAWVEGIASVAGVSSVNGASGAVTIPLPPVASSSIFLSQNFGGF